MEFLFFNKKSHNYKDLFKTYTEDDFAHYHCDICEMPYKSKIDALNCCSQKKVKFLEILDKWNIKPKKLLKNIDKLDEMFQRFEFGRKKNNLLWGCEYYPFYNLIFLKTLQDWNGINDFVVSDITSIGLYKPKDYYRNVWRSWCQRKAREIKRVEVADK